MCKLCKFLKTSPFKEVIIVFNINFVVNGMIKIYTYVTRIDATSAWLKLSKKLVHKSVAYVSVSVIMANTLRVNTKRTGLLWSILVISVH